MLMRTKSETLTVNPAFLQEIKDSHPDLWHTVHEVRQVCHSEGEPAHLARALIRLLGQLRDHLALQFALEESYGYIECPGVIEKRVCEYADIARGQHFRLFLQLTDLCELAEELEYRGFAESEVQRLIEDTLGFDAAFMQHERSEDDLIELAYFDQNRDSGPDLA